MGWRKGVGWLRAGLWWSAVGYRRGSARRCGLLVHFTAPTVHPGFEGTLPLEMINLGPAPILLIPGMAIAQLIVEEVRGIPVRNPSQFQGQSAPEGVVGGA